MILRLFLPFVILAILGAGPVFANALTLPSHASRLADRTSPMDSYALPMGPLDVGKLPTLDFEGRIERQSWRLNGTADTTLQVLVPLRDQIMAAGFDILFDCRDLDCGGFDFRFATEVIPAPDMYVNIRDFRFLAAMRGDNEALSVLISRIGTAIYIQVIHASPPEQSRLSVGLQDPSETTQVLAPSAGGLMDRLGTKGHVVLRDLDFETGETKLGDGPYESLEQLAAFLGSNSDLRIALVGHTDSVGSLDANISLSKRRARSVRERMIGTYTIDPARIDAEGMGYLAPVASNLTDKGREENRRVEAILLSN